MAAVGGASPLRGRSGAATLSGGGSGQPPGGPESGTGLEREADRAGTAGAGIVAASRFATPVGVFAGARRDSGLGSGPTRALERGDDHQRPAEATVGVPDQG